MKIDRKFNLTFRPVRKISGHVKMLTTDLAVALIEYPAGKFTAPLPDGRYLFDPPIPAGTKIVIHEAGARDPRLPPEGV